MSSFAPRRNQTWLALLIVVLGLLAWIRPIDHDESQYVAAAVLSAAGRWPYRDYGYLQTPLQPLLFGPVAALAGTMAWPALRLVNAALGAFAVAGVLRAARAAGAGERIAMTAAALFAATDILLFSIGTARNDALPVALLAWALPLAIRGERGEATKMSAVLAGLLLAAAAAAKGSYALPALAYGGWALVDRRHRPACVALGAVPAATLVAGLYLGAPAAFAFDVFAFPVLAPDQYYRAGGRAWKLGMAAKGIDALKFLALGPALPAIALAVRDWRRGGPARLLDLLILAGSVAALLPSPTWRQYLLPMLPPLFVRLAIVWREHPPGRLLRVTMVVFAVAGIAPSLAAIWQARTGAAMTVAMADSAAIGQALDRAGATGPVATLSPQYLPATGRLPDPRLATGPFYFRSDRLLPPERELAFRLLSCRSLADTGFAPGAAVLVGGEALVDGGDPALDAALAAAAAPRAAQTLRVRGGRFTIYVMPLLQRGCPPGSGCVE